MRRFLDFAIVVALFALGALVALAEPPADLSSVQRDAHASFEQSDGWCEALSTTAENLWASKPARITTAQEGQIRYLELYNSGSVNLCFMIGDNNSHGSGNTLDCSSLGANTSGIIPAGATKTIHVRRTKAAGSTTGDSPAIWIEAASGTPSVCVTGYW